MARKPQAPSADNAAESLGPVLSANPSKMPAPLVGPEVDLRRYDWFPLYHKRLRQSAFWRSASDKACRLNVDFWAEAYEQVPTGSLPDDDHLLAEWAGFGRREIKKWLAVKDEVMGPWIKCADGRWYHPTLCEVARKAWTERQDRLWQRECDRIRKANVRRKKEGLEPLPLPIHPKENSQASCGNTLNSGGKGDVSAGKTSSEAGIPAENALKEESREEKESSLRSDALVRGGRGAFFDRFWAVFPKKTHAGDAESEFDRILDAGEALAEDLIAGAERYAREMAGEETRFIVSPVRWLRGKRWKDDYGDAAQPTLPIIRRDSDEGRAWDAYSMAIKGKPMFWTNGRATVETRFPPDLPPPDEPRSEGAARLN